MDIWNAFPILKPGNEVHLQPNGGTLFADSSPYELSAEQADFLAQCDGVHRVSELVPSRWSETHGDLKFLLLVTRLIEADRLLLKPNPTSHQVCVTGSRSAYIPPHMSIELTAGCNLRCRHCYRESDITKNGHMETQGLLDILGQLNDAGLRSVELTGGEPLLHKDFDEILDLCSNRFALVGVLTNGTILNNRILRRFVDLSDRLLLSISLDGSTADAHDLRRGVPGSFLRTTRNIERLSQSGIKVRISMSVDEDSFFDIENTLLPGASIGCYSI